MDVRLRESELAGFHYVLLGSKKGENFPRTNGDLTKPILTTVLLLCQSNFVDLLQIKDKFHCQESIIIHRPSVKRERKQKKNPIFIFKSVRVRLRESVRLWKCANTKCDWEVKRGFEKASGSRAVRLRECPFIAGS